MFSHSVDEKTELRLPEERHAEAIYALVRRNLARLQRWMPWATDDYALQHAHDFIRRNLQQFADNQGFSASIFYEGRLAGAIGLNWINWQNRKTEIGYWLSEDLEGRGIMTRSCRALVNHAFLALKLNRVEMYVGVANDRSRRIPERLGFRPEGTLRQAEWLHDHFNDLVLYAMLAEEWKEKEVMSDE
jgi:ribosomal-protein-serine acetyltransferase